MRKGVLSAEYWVKAKMRAGCWVLGAGKRRDGATIRRALTKFGRRRVDNSRLESELQEAC
jgi:hypothetical protein